MYKGHWTGEVVIGTKVMVTTSKAAEMLSMPVDTVRRFCDEGKIPFQPHPEQGYRLIPLSYIESQLKRG